MSGEAVSGLYLHVPFCRRRCQYCHFAIARNQASQHERFIKALKQEWSLRHSLVGEVTLRSLYFGGGTPSLLDPRWIQELVEFLPPAKEITLEMNPEDVTDERAARYKEAGINRVSLGVQTLSDPLLRSIGRGHTGQQALQAIDSLSKAGIENISIDLILELPDQTLDQVQQTLSTIVHTPITHLSLYNLTIESPAPYFWRQALVTSRMPAQEEALEMLQWTVQHLRGAGFERYEISAFNRGPFQSVHNRGYWRGLPFLGLGPAACSFVGGQRTRNVAELPAYLRCMQAGQDPTDEIDALSEAARRRELLAVGLRLLEGVDLLESAHQFGALAFDDHQTIAGLVKEGLLIWRGNRLCLTEQGLLFHDQVASRLI